MPTTFSTAVESVPAGLTVNGRALVVAMGRTGGNPNFPADLISQGKPRSRPLCPYPQQARYRGAGDINDAASFSCQ